MSSTALPVFDSLILSYTSSSLLWNPFIIVFSSVIIFFSSVITVWYFLIFSFSFFVEILTLFMHRSCKCQQRQKINSQSKKETENFLQAKLQIVIWETVSQRALRTVPKRWRVGEVQYIRDFGEGCMKPSTHLSRSLLLAMRNRHLS